MPTTDHNGVAITNPATQDAYLAVQSANITRIKGVEDDDMPTIQKLLTTWRDHYARNMLRAEYYQPDTDTTASPTASPKKCAPSPNQ